MHEDKKEAPSLIIPKGLLTFARTPAYDTFLHTIYNYCKVFNQSLKKYQMLKEKLEGRVSEEIMLLQKEKDLLLEHEKELVLTSLFRATSTRKSCSTTPASQSTKTSSSSKR